MEIDALENEMLIQVKKALTRYNERLKTTSIVTKAYIRWYNENDDEFIARPDNFKYCMIAVDFCKSERTYEIVIPLREFITSENMSSIAEKAVKKIVKDVFKYSALILKEGSVIAKAIFKNDLEKEEKKSFKDYLTKQNIMIFLASVVIIIVIIDIVRRIVS